MANVSGRGHIRPAASLMTPSCSAPLRRGRCLLSGEKAIFDTFPAVAGQMYEVRWTRAEWFTSIARISRENFLG